MYGPETDRDQEVKRQQQAAAQARGNSDLNSASAQAQVTGQTANANLAQQQNDAANAAYGNHEAPVEAKLAAPIADFFSAETVNGPAAGSWGQGGTQAANYNAGVVSRGRAANEAATQTGQGIAAANNGVAQSAANRGISGADYGQANSYSQSGDSARAAAARQAMQAGDSSTQRQQLDALNRFAASGPGPSAAQAQLEAGSDAAQRSALSMARSGRGAGDSASALRDASFSNATTQGNVAGQSAQLRAQEDASFKQRQLEALNSAMGGASSIRGADTQAAQVMQGMRAQDLAAQQQAAQQAQFDTSAKLSQTGLNDNLQMGMTNAANQSQLGFASLGQTAETNAAQLGQNALNSQADYELAQQQMSLDAAKANQQADLEKDSGISGMVGAAAGVFGLSDERVKNLKHKESSLAKALETVGNAPGYSYEYKDPTQPGAKPGRQYGPMAQDLEKGPLGDTVVRDTPSGKMVDYGRVAMLGASAITELNHKVKALEKALGKRSAA